MPACPSPPPLLRLLKLSARRYARASQAFLQDVRVCRLYPLVVVLLRLDDLEAELLVEVDGRLIADLHVTGGMITKNENLELEY